MVPVIIRDMYPRECGAGEGGSQSQCDKDVLFLFFVYIIIAISKWQQVTPKSTKLSGLNTCSFIYLYVVCERFKKKNSNQKLSTS